MRRSLTRFRAWVWWILLLWLSFLFLACAGPLPPSSPTAAPPAAVAANPAATATATASLTATPETQAPSPTEEVRESAGALRAARPLIGLIAGHGGPEAGAVHRDAQGRVDLVEKDLTLAVALRLRELLQARGFGVVLDREGDAAVNAWGADLNGDGVVDDADEIQARLDLLNAAKADVLLSIHFNGYPSPAVRGTATYYCPDRPFAAQSRRLAELAQEALVGRLRALGAQVVDKGVQDDAVLGKPYGHLMTLGPATPRITRPGQMPGALVEPLFLTNEYEAGLLKEAPTLEGMAQGLAQALEAHLAREPGPTPPPAEAPAPPPSQKPPPVEAAPQPPAPRSPQARPMGEVVRGLAVPLVALTFDLGSGATHTPAILETLGRQGVTTTFFMTGQWVEANPGLARRILDLGHEPGNHSYSHPDLTKLPDPQVIEEISRMEEALQKASGRSSKPWFRPPFGARNERVLELVSRLGYSSVYWTLDSADWRPELAAEVVRQRVVSQATPGAIIVLHGDSPQTAQVLGSIITGLRARGLEPVSLSRLLAE